MVAAAPAFNQAVDDGQFGNEQARIQLLGCRQFGS